MAVTAGVDVSSVDEDVVVDGDTSETESRESGSRPPVCASELVAGAASAASLGDETLEDSCELGELDPIDDPLPEDPLLADAAWSLPIPPPPPDEPESLDDEDPLLADAAWSLPIPPPPSDD